MKLVNQKTNILENPQFQKWTSAVTNGYKDSQAADMAGAATLAKQYGDEALAKMLVEAKQVPSTGTVAAKLEEAQANNWLSRGQTADYVFRVLKVDKEKYGIMRSPHLSTWVSYVEKTKGNPYQLLLEKMKAQRLSDAAIANMLVGAKQDPATSSIAKKGESALFESWKSQSADDIFKLLKLDDDQGGNLFTGFLPCLSTWVSYVTKLEGKQADKRMYSILRATYGDDEIARILVVSKKRFMGDVAARLEEVQQKVWLSEGKTAKGVFVTLKLNTQGDKLFKSPALSTWVNYVTKLSPKKADEVILSTLKTSYADDAQAKIFVAAKGSSGTKVMAGQLERAQIKDWLRNDQSADDVFKLLKLDDDVDNVLDNPLLSHWLSFVEKLDENPYSILLTKLKTSKLTDTDDKLVGMLIKEKTKATTSAIAGKLEAAQLDKWVKEGETAGAMFKLLKLDDEGDFLLFRQSTRAWVAYVNKLDPKNADDIILSVLKPYHTETQLARVVSTGRMVSEDTPAKFEKIILDKWLREKKSADEVFNFVLNEPHDQMFKSRDFNTWVSYVTKLDKEDPYKTMWLVLQKHFDERELSSMVYKAEASSRTKELGRRLLEQMWLSEPMAAREAFNRLRLNRLHSLLFESPELTWWAAYVTKLDPKTADEVMFSVLQPLYSKKELAKLLKVAKEVDETKDLATRLERQWLLSKAK